MLQACHRAKQTPPKVGSCQGTGEVTCPLKQMRLTVIRQAIEGTAELAEHGLKPDSGSLAV